jgi:hypothetical protein
MLGFPIVPAKGIMASNLIEMHPPHSGEGDTQLLHCIALHVGQELVSGLLLVTMHASMNCENNASCYVFCFHVLCCSA